VGLAFFWIVGIVGLDYTSSSSFYLFLNFVGEWVKLVSEQGLFKDWNFYVAKKVGKIWIVKKCEFYVFFKSDLISQ
jgi:hypothetical protein